MERMTHGFAKSFATATYQESRGGIRPPHLLELFHRNILNLSLDPNYRPSCCSIAVQDVWIPERLHDLFVHPPHSIIVAEIRLKCGGLDGRVISEDLGDKGIGFGLGREIVDCDGHAAGGEETGGRLADTTAMS